VSVEPPFDTLSARKPGGRLELSLDEFLALPLPERIRLILESDTTFLKHGKAVERKQALAQFRTWTASQAAGGAAAGK
jgi:hypothetical protein